MDQRICCRFERRRFVLQQTARAPRGLAERIAAVAKDGKVYDWMTVISYSACLQANGTYVRERVSLDRPAQGGFAWEIA